MTNELKSTSYILWLHRAIHIRWIVLIALPLMQNRQICVIILLSNICLFSYFAIFDNLPFPRGANNCCQYHIWPVQSQNEMLTILNMKRNTQTTCLLASFVKSFDQNQMFKICNFKKNAYSTLSTWLMKNMSEKKAKLTLVIYR